VTGKRGKSESPLDAALWHRIAESIEPLPRRAKRKAVKIEVAAKPPAEKIATTTKPPKPAKAPAAAKKIPPLPELSHGRAPGLDASSHEKLKRGRMKIEGRIDLHGYTLEAGHKALADFIQRAYERELRTIIVITGKGVGKSGDGEARATLRQSVPRWLNEPALRKRILAFSQAQPQHGGSGALYVLLKRRRES